MNVQAQRSVDAIGCCSPSQSVSNTKSSLLANKNAVTDTARALIEINTSEADAYPYLSSDGLRLYFTQESVDGVNLYSVSRTSVNSVFSNKKKLSFDYPPASMSCWLTNDELEIYYSSLTPNTLFYSKRSSLADSFPNSSAIELMGNTTLDCSISGPSFTPDKKEMYLYSIVRTDTNTIRQILQFTKSGTSAYKLSDTLKLPFGEVGPGQLSKDGLRYYLSISEGGNFHQLYYLSRANLNSKFSNLTKLSNKINAAEAKGQLQPSVSNNIIVWSKNSKGIFWEGNDLYIASDKFTTFINENVVSGNYTIYPNPSTEKVYIRSQEKCPLKVEVYNILGACVFRTELASDDSAVDISSLTRGVYILSILSDKGSSQLKLTKE